MKPGTLKRKNKKKKITPESALTRLNHRQTNKEVRTLSLTGILFGTFLFHITWDILNQFLFQKLIKGTMRGNQILLKIKYYINSIK